MELLDQRHLVRMPGERLVDHHHARRPRGCARQGRAACVGIAALRSFVAGTIAPW